ncbi:hypothetical protein N8I77_000071 [Diaporthe amygdali]|uniref:Gylcosyl hydrolase 115 C-terminal domain-containing protein n=1 Tax=Phomopsis amygdali TaxID=1214568 RepID=A0AAD9W7Z0_PHOAM|nr:hypothetical protein N8I77_000071 [Diaporthe amygdali]
MPLQNFVRSPAALASAIPEEGLVMFSKSAQASVELQNSVVVVDERDYEGVHIAARNLAVDFSRVTKEPPKTILISNSARIEVHGGVAIVIGCIESSSLVQKLENSGKVDFSAIRGKWESFQTSLVREPLEGCSWALVIAGSDKRGTIYGTYTLSEQIGVSPWYWWADVPPQHHPQIFATDKTNIHGTPSVKYRGIFINDEAPALTGWVREKFGGYNVQFYEKVFELLLRLKANFLWPAMWPGFPNPGASFFTDDPDSQKAADTHGIVMSTSHHEPMQRLSNEWLAEGNPLGTWDWISNKEKITQFFRKGVERAQDYESYFTMGMRGEYDTKMKGEDPAAVVRDVLRTQRSLIKEVHGREDAVPQLLALYKEVQVQYESGRLGVPDDVTLLFSDDNFGSIRRLPHGDESKRKGGAGLYYHLEYVGTPRSYKWINSNSLGKTWHQLQEAHSRGARQIWVFNVGDIKPLELPLTFAMSLAWDINSVKPDGIPDFFLSLSARQFGVDLSQDIAKAWHEYDTLVALRRHEHIEPTTFSLLHYREAEQICAQWESLLRLAQSIYDRATEEQKPAIFQLVLHPIKASAIFVRLQVNLARNQMYARQRRNSTNLVAKRVLELFDADFDLSEEYHTLLGGKWNNILSQPHYGFRDTWHAPSRDMISGLCYVQTRQRSNPIVGNMGVMVEGHEGVRPGLTNENSDFTHPSRGDLVPGVTLGLMSRYSTDTRWFELFTRGPATVHWSLKVHYPWVSFSKESGTLVPGEEDQRIGVGIQADLLPSDFDEVILIDVCSEEGDFEQIHIPVTGRLLPPSFGKGHVEMDGHILIPAPAGQNLEHSHRFLPDTGRSPRGSIALRPDNENPTPSFVDYKFFVFSDTRTTGRSTLVLYFNMTLDFDPTDPMAYEYNIDDGDVHRELLLEPEPARDPELPSPEGWLTAVQDCSWKKQHILDPDTVSKGEHVIHVRLLHTNLILENIAIDLGGLKDSYLGPLATIEVTG